MNSVNFELKSLSHSKGQNCYHVILVPRARYPVFKYEDQRNLCEEGLKIVCRRHNIDLYAYEIMPDHVHLFISCPPRKSILKLCSLIKGAVSHYIRSNAPALRKYPRLWSRGIFYRSVGNVSAEAVKNYINNSQGNKWRMTREMQTTLSS